MTPLNWASTATESDTLGVRVWGLGFRVWNSTSHSSARQQLVQVPSTPNPDLDPYFFGKTYLLVSVP